MSSLRSQRTENKVEAKRQPLLRRTTVEKLFDDGLEVVRKKGLVDFHTHGFPFVKGAKFNRMSFFGPRRATAYHYNYGRCFAEARLSDKALRKYGKMSLIDQSDWLISQLKKGGHEVCEASMGLVTMAHNLGIRTSSRCLGDIFGDWVELADGMDPAEYVDHVFDSSPVNRIISTNSIFSRDEYDTIYSKPKQMELWDRQRFGFALRLDELIHQRKKDGTLKREFAQLAREMGFPDAAGDIRKGKTQKATRALVRHWVVEFDAEYAAVSLHGGTRFDSKDDFAVLVLESAIIPACVEANIPVVLMPFVRRQIKPLHQNAGDVVMDGDIDGLIDFMSRHIEAFFMVTPLNANHHQALVMASRALGNVCLWGHWWINLVPGTIELQMRERFENLGFAHFGVNSDLRILDQMLYKFDHYFLILKRVLVDKAMDAQILNGRRPTKANFVTWISTLQDHERVFGLARGATNPFSTVS
jgi:hypothetical protein